MAVPEFLANYYAETTLSANYTAGDSNISVTSWAVPPMPPNGTFFSIGLLDATTREPITLLRGAGVASGTTIPVGHAGEGDDNNAPSGSIVVVILTKTALEAWWSNRSQSGAYSNLPSTTYAVPGDIYKCTDSAYEFRYEYDSESSSYKWIPYYQGYRGYLINPSDFSWVNQGSGGNTATVDFTQGYAYFVYPRYTSSEDEHLYVRAVSGSAPTVQDKIEALCIFGPQWTNSMHAGLCVYDSSSTKMMTFAWYNDRNLAVFRRDSPTGSNSLITAMPWTNSSGKYWLRILFNTSGLTFQASHNGTNWQSVYNESLASWLGAVTHLGFSGNAQNNSTGEFSMTVPLIRP